VLGISFSSAMIATIDNPKMVLYKNITSGKSLIFENSVIVDNENNYSVSISVLPDKNWSPYVNVKNSQFTLQPNESKEVFYTIKLNKAGDYAGDIIVTFKDASSGNQLSLAQRIVVKATEVENKQINLKPYIYTLGILIVILLVLIIIKSKFARKNKK
jgi:hypothetical protein